jgi:glycosyltransferase involved in cell wall biosynthesis
MIFDSTAQGLSQPEMRVTKAAMRASGSRPLRVCTVAYTFYQNDGRVMRYNKALEARGEHVDVVALRVVGQPRKSMYGRIQVTGVQTREVNERSRFSYLIRILLFFMHATVLLSWRCLRSRYDLIHIHSVPDFLVFTAWLPKLTGAKIILDIHDLLPELYASKFGVGHDSPVFKVLLAVEKASIAFADHVITANDLWHQKLVNRSVAPERATVLLNFPDRSVFRARGRTRTDDKFIMIYPGTLNWHQGLDIAIEAFAKIRYKVPNAEFHIYGVGPALSVLAEMVKNLDLESRVQFKGVLSLQDIATMIENADLGIVPKRKNLFGDEAFSTKSLEFMAMGVPVIVSNTKIDLYYFNDSVVKFFRAGDVDDLSDCMLNVITNKETRSSLIRHGLEFVEENCWDVKKGLYFNVVDSLLQSRL